MSQYSADPAYSDFGSDLPPEPGRMSILAVVSIVLSVLCLTAPLGLIFGGLAIVSISASKGRKRGMGIAIAGTVIGLVFSVLLVLLVWGGSQALGMYDKAMVGPLDEAMVAMEQGDTAPAEAFLSPRAQTLVTDEDWAEFVTEYTAAAGSYSGRTQGMMEMIQTWGELSPPQQQAMQGGGGGGEIPIVLLFDKGPSVVFLTMDPQAAGGGTATNPLQGMLMNMSILAPDGSRIYLITPGTPLPPAGGAAAPTPVPDETEEMPEELPEEAPADQPG